MRTIEKQGSVRVNIHELGPAAMILIEAGNLSFLLRRATADGPQPPDVLATLAFNDKDHRWLDFNKQITHTVAADRVTPEPLSLRNGDVVRVGRAKGIEAFLSGRYHCYVPHGVVNQGMKLQPGRSAEPDAPYPFDYLVQEAALLDPQLSRSHFSVFAYAINKLCILDLGSTNGTSYDYIEG